MSALRPACRLVAVLATHLTAASILILAVGGAAQAVDIEWVIVRDPGNAADPRFMSTDGTTGYGSVGYTYLISKYEITNAQYVEFLNAVAATDTHDLYCQWMGEEHPNPLFDDRGGITRSGSPGGYTYSTRAGREDLPVNYVTFWDVLRFVNWLHNGQPTGAQDSTTTEDGAYTITEQGIADNSITRNAGATIFLTSEDEWYKAAYYDPVSMSYNLYPFADGYNILSCQVPPGTTSHSANCDYVLYDYIGLIDVGSYTDSASPNGSLDQGGNVWEWNEAIVGSERGLRGGGPKSPPNQVRATYRNHVSPTYQYIYFIGFRVARPAPPGVPSLSPVGVALLGTVLGFTGLLRLCA